jgi:hypothetical protein
MPYEINTSKQFKYPFKEVFEAACLSAEAMSAEILKNDAANKRLQIQVDKKLYGRVLGDRSMLEVVFSTKAGGTKVNVLGYPLNAVGQKLMFGARKGVVETVLEAFFIEIEKQLIEK